MPITAKLMVFVLVPNIKTHPAAKLGDLCSEPRIYRQRVFIIFTCRNPVLNTRVLDPSVHDVRDERTKIF